MSGNFVIAGGSQGIGLELVNQLKSTAEQINVYSRNLGELSADEKVHHFPCDFTTDEINLDNLPEEIDGVAYCPGSINLRPFRSLKVSDFRNDLEINLLGAVKFLQACLPGLKSRGRERCSSVVMFSTVAVGQGMPMHASVAAAKGAIEGLTRTLAAEWAPNIRVNCLAPALTETPLTSRFFKSDETRKNLAGKYPLSRTGTPHDIASMAKFLLTPDSSWITGQVLGIDGGLSTLRL